ncbi:MAG: RlmE family RNA methyltransferase [Polyangiales bacterium]
MGQSRSGRPQDAFGKRARKEGYPARSVYKLEEIDRRVRLFRQGLRVLDLGAFPGSWLLYAAERVGGNGYVLGLDIQEHRAALPKNAEFRHADIYEVSPDSLGGAQSYDVVMSDMAPNTTGHRNLDQLRSFELYMRALEIADTMAKPGGSFVGKIFQSGDFPKAKAATQKLFEKVRIIKPEATRSESFECFLVGLGRR